MKHVFTYFKTLNDKIPCFHRKFFFQIYPQGSALILATSRAHLETFPVQHRTFVPGLKPGGGTFLLSVRRLHHKTKLQLPSKRSRSYLSFNISESGLFLPEVFPSKFEYVCQAMRRDLIPSRSVSK